jgi:hypothetical protein
MLEVSDLTYGEINMITAFVFEMCEIAVSQGCEYKQYDSLGSNAL